MNEDHAALAAEAEVLDRAVASAKGQLTQETIVAVDETYRYLSLRFLPHARADEEVCARLAWHDYRRPEGSCGEPEIEALTVRLDQVRTALAQQGPVEALGHVLRTLLDELQPLLRAHFSKVEHVHADSEASASPS